MEIASRTAGGFVVVVLTGLAGYLAPTPEDVEAVFNITAIGSGLAGYWIGSSDDIRAWSAGHRTAIGLVIIFGLPIISLLYMKYYHEPAPGFILDILAFVGFSIILASVCFLLGVLGIDIVATTKRDST